MLKKSLRRVEKSTFGSALGCVRTVCAFTLYGRVCLNHGLFPNRAVKGYD
jgi:hypothetical protein